MKQKKKIYLTAEMLYNFLIGVENKIETMILCNSKEVYLITTDQSLYEAIGSIGDKSKINYNKLVKLLEVAEIKSFRKLMNSPRKILKYERVNEVRKKAGGKS